MSYNIIATPEFLKEAKKPGKKYRSLKEDLAVLIEELQQNPTLGTAFVSFPKIRVIYNYSL